MIEDDKGMEEVDEEEGEEYLDYLDDGICILMFLGIFMVCLLEIDIWDCVIVEFLYNLEVY